MTREGHDVHDNEEENPRKPKNKKSGNPCKVPQTVETIDLEIFKFYLLLNVNFSNIRPRDYKNIYVYILVGTRKASTVQKYKRLNDIQIS
jgi:hypothetical protein